MQILEVQQGKDDEINNRGVTLLQKGQTFTKPTLRGNRQLLSNSKLSLNGQSDVKSPVLKNMKKSSLIFNSKGKSKKTNKKDPSQKIMF